MYACWLWWATAVRVPHATSAEVISWCQEGRVCTTHACAYCRICFDQNHDDFSQQLSSYFSHWLKMINRTGKSSSREPRFLSTVSGSAAQNQLEWESVCGWGLLCVACVKLHICRVFEILSTVATHSSSRVVRLTPKQFCRELETVRSQRSCTIGRGVISRHHGSIHACAELIYICANT